MAPPYVLRENPTKDDNAWKFTVPVSALAIPKSRPNYGKLISFTAEKISLQMIEFPANRILRADDPSKFILLSFGGLRFPDSTIREGSDYIERLLKAGLFLNGVQYRFYHHSNSQLRGRSCFVREAKTDEELDARIYAMGDFGKIMNAAKRAKRIGLLFSEAQMDWILDPAHILDIPDIKSGDGEVFSDGCGLISRRFAVQLAKSKRIVFRGSRYTPTVYQIRYLGYKGVLMLHPDLDAEGKCLAQFRKSMKKFSTTADRTFSVVNFSKPYSFGRLNNDVMVLLSSLAITNDKLMAKQQDYFDWIKKASEDSVSAVDLLCALDKYELAQKVLMDGLDNRDVLKQVRQVQMSEVGRFRNERGKAKAPIFIRNSRRLFGVCDPYQVLREGEVHIRITTARKGASTPIHGDVLVVRNPCLHPGDCLKLRAVQHPKLAHLVDCVVFATVARPGHHPAPSMSSGGDLDGDEYFVCWDKDLVPTRVAEPYDYPGNKESVNKKMARSDLAKHFAAYSGAGVARVAALHAKWVRASPLGALCPECQELNALHSQSVDGARIKIPDRLTNPPEPPAGEPYILELLEEARTRFAKEFTQDAPLREILTTLDVEEGRGLLVELMQSKQSALSEYELFTLANLLARKNNIDIRSLLSHIDVSALTTQEKYALSSTLGFSQKDPEHPYVWNSLIRSDILTPRDLYQRALGRPFSIQRLYSSKVHGLATFFEYLRMATQEYTRKLLLLKTDDRFAVGIFMKGEMPWEEDAEVDKNVVVCSFMPHTASNLAAHRPCTTGYRLHLSDLNFQLYNKHTGDTFVFINRPPRGSQAEVQASIALQKISATVQRQLGRIRTTPVVSIELHVVSNRDRVAHQLFDLWFEHVPTEERVKRFQRQATPYRYNDIRAVDWRDPANHPLQSSFFRLNTQTAPRIDDERQDDDLNGGTTGETWPKPGAQDQHFTYETHTQETMNTHLSAKTNPEIDKIMSFALQYHADHEVFLIFTFMIAQQPRNLDRLMGWVEKMPSLIFALLAAFPPTDDRALAPELGEVAHGIARSIIRSANPLGISALVGLEKISQSIATMPVDQYFDLLMLAAMSVRSQHLVQEVLLVLNDARIEGPLSPAMKYGCKLALSIVFDRAEEAFDECPCDDTGKPRKQKEAPTHVKLHFVPDKPTAEVRAVVRVDARTAVRLHSHVRLQASSKADNRWLEPIILDGVVTLASKGELKIELMHPPPPEMEQIDWNMYHAGIIATTRATMDALLRLLQDKETACSFYNVITGDEDGEPAETTPIEDSGDEMVVTSDRLNDSQRAAIRSCRAPLSLIWGPPGTGKTTVVVDILWNILMRSPEDRPKILMTASTHNAVDNVLERFLKLNEKENLIPEEEILRVATDVTKVNEDLRDYTIDARVGGDMNENNRLAKKARQRVEAACLIFTTCAGAGLGTLRKFDFDIAIIDEASQLTEATALIPLVKGVRQAVLVGDHVQLRPTVRKMGKVLELDISLLERLYTKNTVNTPRMRKTMLDVQYRSPEELMSFPSKEFYEGKLKTGLADSTGILRILTTSAFPWPRRNGQENGPVIPTVFIPWSTEEDFGGMSKSNAGQVELVQYILPLLTRLKEGADARMSPEESKALQDRLAALNITVLTPYTRQIRLLRQQLASSVSCYTVDGFQGRESDIIIFSTVRCNAEGDIGFLDDARRLNVMWTRAKLALIVVGDPQTLKGNPLWKRAVGACTVVEIQRPE